MHASLPVMRKNEVIHIKHFFYENTLEPPFTGEFVAARDIASCNLVSELVLLLEGYLKIFPDKISRKGRLM